jgi:hypothetical protein
MTHLTARMTGPDESDEGADILRRPMLSEKRS